MNANLEKAIALSRPLHWEYNENDDIYYLIDSDSDEILATRTTDSAASILHYTLIQSGANIPQDDFENPKPTNRPPF